MKIKTIILIALAFFALSENLNAQMISPADKVLVVYYSRSGNTKTIANQIHNFTGGDVFELETINAYPENDRDTTKQAKKEIADGYKPALKNKIANIANYDVIFIGSPCWWGTVASPVFTFMSEYDLSGKKIIPFMTHGGSGLGHSVDDIKKALPNSTVVDGQAFWGNDVDDANEEIIGWLKGLKNE